MSDDKTRLLSTDEKLEQILVLAQHTMTELKETRAELKETRAELKETRAELNETRAELHELSEKHSLLEEKVDRRLRETRPIWEAVLQRVEAIEAGFDNLKAELKQELALGLRRIEKRMEIVHKDYDALRLDNVLLEERIEQLESK